MEAVALSVGLLELSAELWLELVEWERLSMQLALKLRLRAQAQPVWRWVERPSNYGQQAHLRPDLRLALQGVVCATE